MTRRTFYIAAIGAAAFCLLVGPASATHVQCGDTITTNTTLDSDVVCPDAYQNYGLLIAADNVLLRMNGFTLRAGANSGDAGILSGSPDEDGLQGVRIKRGSIEGFRKGIVLAPIDDSTLFKVNVTTFDFQGSLGEVGITLSGDRNWLVKNTVTLMGSNSGDGIRLIGDDAYAWGNVVTGSPSASIGHDGIIAQGLRPRLVYNQVTGCRLATGVGVRDYTGYAVVSRNTVSGCHRGVQALADTGSPGGAVVRLNQITGGSPNGQSIGLNVSDQGAIVERNVARGANNTGIGVQTAGTTVRGNEAYDNGEYGIVAQEGTIDGGGNVASGNGPPSDPGRPECVNISCSSP